MYCQQKTTSYYPSSCNTSVNCGYGKALSYGKLQGNNCQPCSNVQQVQTYQATVQSCPQVQNCQPRVQYYAPQVQSCPQVQMYQSRSQKCQSPQNSSCYPENYECAPAVGDSQYLINAQLKKNKKAICKPKPKKYCCNPCDDPCEEKTVWPPEISIDSDPMTLNLFVGKGGNYCDINDAIKSLPKGTGQRFRLYLEPCQVHNLTISLDCELMNLTIIGDTNNVGGLPKGYGVFYGQQVATENLSIPYSKSQLKSGSGVGSYTLLFDKICNPCGPFTITVKSSTGEDPDFSDVTAGTTLSFLRYTGDFTKYKVLYGNCNTITVNCPIAIDSCTKQGEGFFLHPTTTLNFCGQGTQTLLTEEYLELTGLNLTGGRQTTIGTKRGAFTAGFTVNKMDHFVGVGRLDWSLPNVILGETYFVGCIGNIISSTWIGNKASCQLSNSNSVNMLTCNVLHTELGVKALNGSAVSTPYTFWLKNNAALYAGSGSTVSIPGNYFRCNTSAVYSIGNSNITAEYATKAPIESFMIYFLNNGTAVTTVDNSSVLLDTATFNANTTLSITYGQSQITVSKLIVDLNNTSRNIFDAAFFAYDPVHVGSDGVTTVHSIIKLPTALGSISQSLQYKPKFVLDRK